MQFSKKMKVRGIIVGVLVLAVYLFFAGEQNFFKLWRLAAKKRALQAEIVELREKNRDLQMEIRKLRADSTHVEAIARTKYKMGKPDETIYLFKQEAKK